MDDKKITISNDLLLQLSYTFDQICILANELACDASNIGISEEYKKVPVEYRPHNKCASILFLLADYAKLCSKKLQDEIVQAGGDI